MVVLEEIRRVDDEVIKAREEERHDGQAGAKHAVSEYRDFNERSARRAVLLVPLPVVEYAEQDDGDDDEHGNPRRAPTHDVAFCQGEEECEKACCDEEAAQPVHVGEKGESFLGWGLYGGWGWGDEEDAGCGDEDAESS